MDKIVLKTRLKFLKHRLRSEYLNLCSMKDKVSCGNNLLEYISPSYSKKKKECEDLYDECQRLEKEIANGKIRN